MLRILLTVFGFCLTAGRAQFSCTECTFLADRIRRRLGDSGEESADLQGPGRHVPQRVSEQRLTVALEGACEETSEMGPQFVDTCAKVLYQNRDAVEEYLFKNGANGFFQWFCVETLEVCPTIWKDEL
ncbi:hypothetical protein BSKO_04315 [Bryopsis sp. KO-2023]|nr:hypothetical protein BSKO_04315 [Bryopsis sp. KO-2023]